MKTQSTQSRSSQAGKQFLQGHSSTLGMFFWYVGMQVVSLLERSDSWSQSVPDPFLQML